MVLHKHHLKYCKTYGSSFAKTQVFLSLVNRLGFLSLTMIVAATTAQLTTCCKQMPHSSVTEPIVSKGVQDLKLALRKNSHTLGWTAFHPQYQSLKLRHSGWRLISFSPSYQWLTFPNCWVSYRYVNIFQITPSPLSERCSVVQYYACMWHMSPVSYVRYLKSDESTHLCKLWDTLEKYIWKVLLHRYTEYTISVAFKNTLCGYQSTSVTCHSRQLEFLK